MDLRACLPSSLGESEKDAILHSLEEPRGESALLLNTDKIKDEEFLRRYPEFKKHPFVEHAYLYDREQYPFGKSIYYENGAISIEDGAAMMVVNYFLRPEEDDVLLDICAAPGGKSIGASLFMNDKGCIVANDVSYPRAKAMSQNVERMGRGNIVCASNDFLFSKIHFADTFDKILVDAPCSGTAMFRKSEASRRDWRIEKAKSCHTRQVDLLEEAYSMLKPGGILAYSTCSFVELENEGSVLAFKELHPEAEVIDLPDDPTFYRNPKLPGAVTGDSEKIPGHPPLHVGEDVPGGEPLPPLQGRQTPAGHRLAGGVLPQVPGDVGELPQSRQEPPARPLPPLSVPPYLSSFPPCLPPFIRPAPLPLLRSRASAC